MVVKRTMDIHRNKFIGCGSRRIEEAEEFVVLDAFSSPSAKARTSVCYYLIPLEALPSVSSTSDNLEAFTTPIHR
jgi:hypothetical protein